MRVDAIRVTEQGVRRGRARLCARVRYHDSAAAPEVYWVEVPAELADALALDGAPWLAGLLPLAAPRGEPLRIEAPLHPRLLEGARRLLQIWRAWYPALEVEVRAPTAAGDRSASHHPREHKRTLES